MKSIVLIILTLLSYGSFAQIANDLEIYSEGGEKFTVTINGRKLNDEPVSRVEVKNIDYDMVHIIIDFEDSSIERIEKKYYPISGADNTPVVAVGKIVESNGKYKLKYPMTSEKKIQQTNIVINNESPTTTQSNGVGVTNGRVVINW